MKVEDLSKVSDEETPKTLVAPGTYEVTITDAVESQSRPPKCTPCIALDMEITSSGDYKGRGLKDWVYITDRALWRVKQLLNAAQFPFPEGEFDFNPSVLIGRKVDVEVTHEVYNGDVKTRVGEYQRREGYEPPAGANDPKPVDDIPF